MAIEKERKDWLYPQDHPSDPLAELEAAIVLAAPALARMVAAAVRVSKEAASDD